ncbi:MAG: hypothetical protein Q8P31_12575 [Bacillota bacterium]|nr:hypothetical protein [Bacillota bacterium]
MGLGRIPLWCGVLILLMGCLRRESQFAALSHCCAELMEQSGWQLIDSLVNELHRPGGENAVSIAQHRKSRLPMRTHIDIIVGRKP